MKRSGDTRGEHQGTALMTGAIDVRVRYPECDPMSVAHHTAYPTWFEMGRTELCRDAGVSYRDLERAGFALAVVTLEVRYHAPARYDDLVRVETSLMKMTRVKLVHAYRVLRDGLILATGTTTLACLDPEGRPRAIPDELLRLGGDSAPPPER